jgi:hypothetical protein
MLEQCIKLQKQKLTLYSGLNYTIENTLKSKKHQEHIYGDIQFRFDFAVLDRRGEQKK